MERARVLFFLAKIISVVPTNKLRVFLYRKIMGYKIKKSYLGWKTVIIAEAVELIGCRIDSGNCFIGPMKIKIGRGTNISKNNRFICGWWAKSKKFESKQYGRTLNVGENVLITSDHYFDLAGSLIVGNNSWIGGKDSQFWTHGAGVKDRNIKIGKECYISSAVRFAPGSSVGDYSIVALASVVTRKFSEKYVMIGGQPARALRSDYNWKDKDRSNGLQ